MGVINWVAFGGILVDLVIISAIISSAYWGFRKGLAAVLFKVLSFIVALLIVFLLYKPVASSIMVNTQLDEKLAVSIEKSLSGSIATVDGQIVQNTNSISSGVYEIIKSFVEEALEKNEADPIAYASNNLAVFMINLGTMLLVYIIARFFLFFLRFVVELIANLPFIRMFNKSGGLILGIVKGFVTVYLLLAVISIASPLISSWGVIDAIADSSIGSKMYNNNIVINLLSDITTK